MIYSRHTAKGFSLLEVLLVLAIMATIMVSILGYVTQKSDEMRRDRTVMQMQQILNAGLSYYVSFGSWPTSLRDLQGSFLPTGTILNGWGMKVTAGASTEGVAGSQLSVCSPIAGKQAFTAATIIAGRLPIASAIDGSIGCPIQSGLTVTPCTSKSKVCTIVSNVSIPGQNLNNARSINFAGLYHNGACVPAPSCPSTNMRPAIMAIPVSVSGMNDPNTPTNIYPLSSFTAYVTGVGQSDDPGNMPGDCQTDTSSACYQDVANGQQLPTGTYWRVCLRIITQKGTVTYDNSTVADAGVILALTRCVPRDEYTTPSVYGSQFTVFSP